MIDFSGTEMEERKRRKRSKGTSRESKKGKSRQPSMPNTLIMMNSTPTESNEVTTMKSTIYSVVAYANDSRRMDRME